MKSRKIKVGDKIWWYGITGIILALPADDWGEYKVRLDTGEIIYDYEDTLVQKGNLP